MVAEGFKTPPILRPGRCLCPPQTPADKSAEATSRQGPHPIFFPPQLFFRDALDGPLSLMWTVVRPLVQWGERLLMEVEQPK